MTINAQADRAEHKEQAHVEAKCHEELMSTLQMTVLQSTLQIPMMQNNPILMNHLMKSFTGFTGAPQPGLFASPTIPVAPYNDVITPITNPTTMTFGHHYNIIPQYAPPPTPMEALCQEQTLNSMLQEHLHRNTEHGINGNENNLNENENNKDG
jgi:hypothetical protein